MADENEFDTAFAEASLAAAGATGGAGDAGGSGDGAGSGAAAPSADGDGEAAGAAGGGAPEGGEAPAGEGDGAQAPAAGAEGAEAGAGGGAAGAAGGDAGAAAAAADSAPAGKPAAKAAGVQDPAPNADDIVDRLAEALAAKQAKPAETPAAETQEAPILSADEEASIATFQKEWPEEAKAISAMQRSLGVGVIDHVFKQIAPVIKQLEETVQSLATRAHHGDLVQSIGEYSDEFVDQVATWIDTHPAYLQKAMKDVITGGTAAEVSDLVSRYREATGTAPSAGEQKQAPAPKGGDELSGAAKQAAAALAPVGSKRSVVQNPDDASDFDAAWAKFSDVKV